MHKQHVTADQWAVLGTQEGPPPRYGEYCATVMARVECRMQSGCKAHHRAGHTCSSGASECPSAYTSSAPAACSSHGNWLHCSHACSLLLVPSA